MTREVGITTSSCDGLDLQRLANWFSSKLPWAVGGPLFGRLIPGGRSNLTYEIRDGERSWVLRRPPLGHVLATAHDMGREYRVMSALAGTGVPVPVTYALCTDDAVLGAPFYIMEKVEGTPYRSATELALLGPERVHAISQRLVDTLVALHEVDPAEVGLADFGRSDGFLERQIRRWSTQLEASRSRDLPAADELRDLLASNVPAQSAPGIVHGDYRLDNVLFDQSDRPAAIIDWEMATIGDPLTDLALLVVYQKLGRLAGGDAVTDAATAPGFLSEGEVRDRYVSSGGRALNCFGFYLGLAAFKLAGVAEGIYYRHLHGQTTGDGFDRICSLTEPLLEIGISSLKEEG
jgi:aminoglycoside phosphotransferase (APT) family kinase protein